LQPILGHLISLKGVAPDPEKVKAITEWPEPCALTNLRGFLGLTEFYRHFVRHYATLAAPLTDLLQQQKFTWPPATQLAFTNLKQQMAQLPTLHLPIFTLSFIMETYASVVAVGAVLSQQECPLAFFSKKMCPCLQASSTYIKEMYVITEAVKKWRQYFLGNHFKIYTDQKSLNTLISQTIQTPEQ